MTRKIRDRDLQSVEYMSVVVKHEKQKRKKTQNQMKLKASACKKISRLFSDVNEQLVDPTSIQSLNYNSLAVKTSRAILALELHSLCCLLYFLLFIFVPLMKQCENFVLCSIF